MGIYTVYFLCINVFYIIQRIVRRRIVGLKWIFDVRPQRYETVEQASATIRASLNFAVLAAGWKIGGIEDGGIRVILVRVHVWMCGPKLTEEIE